LAVALAINRDKGSVGRVAGSIGQEERRGKKNIKANK
jgi:hypothetical protein